MSGGMEAGNRVARAIQCHVLIAADDAATAGCVADQALDALVGAALDALSAAMDGLDVIPGAEVSLVVADDAYLHRLNLSYRGYDKPTDVLSFRTEHAGWPGGVTGDAAGDAASDGAGEVAPGSWHELGDIVISLPYAARSAVARNAPVVDELRLLAVHGLLHLLGHDDADEAGAAAMRAEEVRLGVRAAEDV